jgi:hypothetical protein
MVMSRDQNAGRGHSVKIDNSSIERVEEFKYLGTTVTDQNSIQEEIKSRLILLHTADYHLICSIDLMYENQKWDLFTTFLPITNLIYGHNASHNDKLFTCSFLYIKQQRG